MENLKDKINTIIEQGNDLKKLINDYDLAFDYISIFTNTTKEYDFLLEQALEYGEVVRETNEDSYVKFRKSFNSSEGDLVLIRIKKPNQSEEKIGYINYYSQDFELIKNKVKDINIIKLPESEVLELKNSENKVIIYITTESHIGMFNSNEDSDDQEIGNLKIVLEEEKNKRIQLMADFQNYQRRVENEKSSWGAIANMSLIQDSLEIYDDMQLALQDENLNLDNAKNAITTAQNKIIESIKRSGVEKVEVKVGDEFDKEKMEAVSVIPAGDEKKGKVIAVISSAYKYSNKEGILKAAKVVVGK